MQPGQRRATSIVYLALAVLTIIGLALIATALFLYATRPAAVGPVASNVTDQLHMVTPRPTTPAATEMPVTVITSEPTEYVSPPPRQLTATAGADDGLIYDFLNGFRITVPARWFVHVPDSLAVMGFTSLSNYSTDMLSTAQLEGTTPPDAVSGLIISQAVDSSIPFDEWLEGERQKQLLGENGVPPGTTLTQPELQRLGHHSTIAYNQVTPDGYIYRLIYLPVKAERVLVMSYAHNNDPADAAALAELLDIFATIESIP